MALETDLVAGFDPSVFANISQAQLLQMINRAEPTDKVAFVIYSNIAPDVVNNPRYKKFIWADTSLDVDRPILRLYDTSGNSWEVIGFPDNSFSGTIIQNGTLG